MSDTGRIRKVGAPTFVVEFFEVVDFIFVFVISMVAGSRLS